MRVADIFLSVGEPDLTDRSTCACCGFDAVLTFPVTLMSGEGVGPFGTITCCVRCFEEGCSCSPL